MINFVIKCNHCGSNKVHIILDYYNEPYLQCDNCDSTEYSDNLAEEEIDAYN